MNTRSIRTTAAQLTQMLADVDIATASDCISDEELVDFALGTTAEADGRLRIIRVPTVSAGRLDRDDRVHHSDAGGGSGIPVST